MRYTIIPRLYLIEKTLGHLRDTITHRNLTDCLRVASIKKIKNMINTRKDSLITSIDEIISYRGKGQDLSAF